MSFIFSFFGCRHRVISVSVSSNPPHPPGSSARNHSKSDGHTGQRLVVENYIGGNKWLQTSHHRRRWWSPSYRDMHSSALFRCVSRQRMCSWCPGDDAPSTEVRFWKSGVSQTRRMPPQNHSPETRAAKSCRRPTRGGAAQRNDGMDVQKPPRPMIADAGRRVPDLLALRAVRSTEGSGPKLQTGPEEREFSSEVSRTRDNTSSEPRGSGAIHASLHFSGNDQPFSRPRAPCRSPGVRLGTSRVIDHRRGSSHLNSERMAHTAWESGFAWEANRYGKALTGRVWWRTFLR